MRLVASLVFVYYFLSLVTVTHANIRINECLPDLPPGIDERQEEWVELINISDNRVDISGYVLKDEKLNQLVLVNESSTSSDWIVEPGGFIVIKRRGSRFSLNNDSDSVHLYESTQAAEPVDSISYSNGKTGLSYGRLPDGSDSLIWFDTPSPLTKNIPNLTPTPTPTSTPKPTKIPKSTSKLTLTPTPSAVVQSSQIEQSILGTISRETPISVENNSSKTSTSAAEATGSAYSLPHTHITGDESQDSIDTNKEMINQRSLTHYRYFFVGGGALLVGTISKLAYSFYVDMKSSNEW